MMTNAKWGLRIADCGLRNVESRWVALCLWLSLATCGFGQAGPVGVVKMSDWVCPEYDRLSFEHRITLNDLLVKVRSDGAASVTWQGTEIIALAADPTQGESLSKKVEREQGAGGFLLSWADQTTLDVALTREGLLFFSFSAEEGSESRGSLWSLPTFRGIQSVTLTQGENRSSVSLSAPPQSLSPAASISLSLPDQKVWLLTWTEGSGSGDLLGLPWGWQVRLPCSPKKTTMFLNLSSLFQEPLLPVQAGSPLDLLKPDIAPSKTMAPGSKRWRIQSAGQVLLSGSLAGSDPKVLSVWLRQPESDQWQRMDQWIGTPLSFTHPFSLSEASWAELELRGLNDEDPLSHLSTLQLSSSPPAPDTSVP